MSNDKVKYLLTKFIESKTVTFITETVLFCIFVVFPIVSLNQNDDKRSNEMVAVGWIGAILMIGLYLAYLIAIIFKNIKNKK